MVMISMKNLLKRLPVAVTALCLAVTGCEDFGGGAVLVPEVVFLPPDLNAASDDAAVEETSSASESTEAASAGGTGTFKGRVVLSGSGPKLPLAPLIAKGADVKDKESCSIEAVPNERLEVSADNGVRNVFVYLKSAPKGVAAPPLPNERLIFDQKVCRFVPHCMVVATGQPVAVLNDDKAPHNTHTYPVKNDPVNQVVSGGEREGKLEIVYTRAEAVPLQVKCDYHTWMVAYHLPLDHPFAAVTDENGNFEIPNLPAGTHEFIVWHEAAGYVERKLEVKVQAGEGPEQIINFPADKVTL